MQFLSLYQFQSNAFKEIGTSDDAEPLVAQMGSNFQHMEGAKSKDFMVTEILLSEIHDILSEDNGHMAADSIQLQGRCCSHEECCNKDGGPSIGLRLTLCELL